MNFEQQLSQATELARSGRFEEAESACRRLLQTQPKSFETLQLLGLAQARLGRANEAVATLKQAMAKDHRHAGIHNHLGHALMSLGRFEEAHRCFEKAAEISPGGPEAHVGLGSALTRLGKIDDAQAALQQALRAAPDLPPALDALGVCLLRQGRLREAMDKHLEAAQRDPPLPSAFINLFNAMMLMHVTDDARRVAQAAIAALPAVSAEAAELQVGLAKLGWIEGRLKDTDVALEASEGLLTGFEGYLNLGRLRASHRLLRRLATQRAGYTGPAYDGDPSRALFFVADSHALPPSETVVYHQGQPHRVLSALIEGCRVRDLAAAAPNELQASLSAILRAIPAGHPVVVGFGERDCRLGADGLLDEDDASSRLPDRVDRYVDFVARTAAEHGHTLLLYGVPAPHPAVVERASEALRQRHVALIRRFNNGLRESCRRRSLAFLDVYALTTTVEGVADGSRHVDEHHVYPGSVRDLMERPPRP